MGPVWPDRTLGKGARYPQPFGGLPIKRVELDPSPSAPAIAREAVREEFTGRFPSEAVASAELVASELVTNAVKYGVPEVILTVHEVHLHPLHGILRFPRTGPTRARR